MAKKYTGRCACGALKFEFDTDPTFIVDCYRKDCQKASGGAMATFLGVPKGDFTLTSGKPKSFHYVAEIRERPYPEFLSGLALDSLPAT